MTEEKKENSLRDTYEDFLSDISEQFARRDEEKDFMDNIGYEPPEADILVNVGERVKQVREKRGLSLRDISQRTDIDVSTLTQIEEGDFAPPLGTVIKLAKALKMKRGYFISGEEDRPYTIVRRKDRKGCGQHTRASGRLCLSSTLFTGGSAGTIEFESRRSCRHNGCAGADIG